MEKTTVLHSAYSMVIFTIAMFILISIATFSPNDPPFANYPVNQSVQNCCGKIGAIVSGYMISCIGATSYVFAILIGTLGVLLFFKKKIEILWVKILGGTLLIVSVATILGIFGYITSILKLPPKTGGIIGFIAAVRLTEYLGITGTCILLASGFFISIMLIYDKSLEIPLYWVSSKIKRIFIARPLASDYEENFIDRELSNQNWDIADEHYEPEVSVKEEKVRDDNTNVKPVDIKTKHKKRSKYLKKYLVSLKTKATSFLRFRYWMSLEGINMTVMNMLLKRLTYYKRH